jgi:hypothetical protein
VGDALPLRSAAVAGGEGRVGEPRHRVPVRGVRGGCRRQAR